MCKCKENNWCRTWEETCEGIFPASDHAPGCNKYKQNDYIQVNNEHGLFIVETLEADYFGGGDIIKLTEDQFNNLNEFQGI